METRTRRLTILGISVLVLAVAGIGIAQASGRPTVAATAPAAATGGSATVGIVVAGSLTSDAAIDSTAAVDEAIDDDAIAALGLAELTAFDEPSQDRAGTAMADRLRDRITRLRRAHGKRLERFVHAETTLDLPKKGITTVGADHGTIASIGDGTIALKRADGQTVTLKTDTDTKVRAKVRAKGDAAALADLKVGDELLVVSRKTGETWTAKRILLVPIARTAPEPSTAPGA